MAKLPRRPQWYKDKIAALRADRTAGHVPPGEFLDHAVDEIERHPDYVRDVLRADASAYDRAVTAEQRAGVARDEFDAIARGFIQASILSHDALAKLGLQVELDLGFGRKVDTVDAGHADRLKAIKEKERSRDSWVKSKNDEIAAIRALDDLAGDKTLREIIDDRPEEGTGTL